MARTANVTLNTATARLRLAPRAKPYSSTIAKCRRLGYIRASTGAGRWLAIVETGRSATGSAILRQHALGEADDITGAKGVTYSEALAAAAAWQPNGGPGGALTVRAAIASYVAGKRAAAGELAADGAWRSLLLNVLREDSKGKPLPGARGLGDREIVSLELSELRKWRDGLATRKVNPIKKSSVNRTLTNFKAVLNHAFGDTASGIVNDAAWRRLAKFEDVAAPREEHFTEAEVGHLIRTTQLNDAPFADLLQAAFHTGARYGELCVVDVQHVNALRRTLFIPSGKTGARTVTLTAEGAAFFVGIAKGRSPDEPLLQPAGGGRWLPAMQCRRMKAALAAAGLPSSAVLYTLRHTYISRAIESHMPLTLIAKNVGTSLLMIERTYSHMLHETERAVIEATGPRLALVAM
jgi:integrase